MKITYARLINCINAGSAYITYTGLNNKLAYALKRFSTQNLHLAEEFTYKSNDLKVDFASIDEKENLIKQRGPQGEDIYSYTKENQKLLASELRKLSATIIEVEPFITNSIPKGLLPEQINLFAGLVIPLEEEGSNEQTLLLLDEAKKILGDKYSENIESVLIGLTGEEKDVIKDIFDVFDLTCRIEPNANPYSV